MELNDRVCRMCLTAWNNLCSLFDSSKNLDLLAIIRNTVRLEIAEDDEFSKMICKQCISRLKTIDAHVKLFQESDRKLRCAIDGRPKRAAKTSVSQDSEVESAETQHSVDAMHEPKLANDDAKAMDNKSTKQIENADINSSRRSVRIRTRFEHSEKHHETEMDNRASTRVEMNCHNECTDSSTEADHLFTSSLSQKLETNPIQQKRTIHHNRQSKRTAQNKADLGVPMLHDFKCYICSSEPLGSRKALIEHLATHVDKVPFTCKQCVMETITLTRVRTLNTHMKMHEQPIKCDYCDRRYSNAAGKYYHTHTYHLAGGAPCTVNCKICGKQYGSQAALKQHMKYHTTTLKCSKCDMVFNHPNKLRNHEHTHNENRGYECVVCKKVLQTIESYDVHLKKHSQERSYQCTLCPKKFNTSFNLILHLKVHAKNYNYRPAKSWVEHYTILSRDPLQYKCNHCERYSTGKVNNMISHLQAHFKEYECDQCKRLFATAKQLRAHYTTHTGEKSEMCQHCGKCFSTKNNLRIHLKCHERESNGTAESSEQARGTTQDCPPEPCIEIEAVSNSTSIIQHLD
ncbi:zinc finger protein 37-like [Anopheles maculipalpis]|uniref:zinc finger protein 37-like n=1 Tax=Anopheles maculipalpis TaxID=1496333 RepID=UPI002158C63B|nr:zinc finger protein 37-like [Anopheles maculipalpis]